MKRRRQGRFALGALVASLFVVAGLGGAETVAAGDSPCPPPNGRALCVSVTHTPADVPAASAGAPTFVVLRHHRAERRWKHAHANDSERVPGGRRP